MSIQTTIDVTQLTHQLTDARDQVHNANLRADRAKRERDAIATDLDQLRTDVRAMFRETSHEREANDLDRLKAFHHRKVAFFHKHQELLKPRTAHEDAPGSTARP
jgi:hypothetical protein